MVHSTPARKEAKILKQRASDLAREIKVLEGIEGTAHLTGERQAEAARLEDITVWEDSIVKHTKKGEKKYGRWLAGWREGGKLRKVYLGSCRKPNQAEALRKASGLKAEALGLHIGAEEAMEAF